MTGNLESETSRSNPGLASARQDIICFATAGRGSSDEERIQALLGDFDTYVYRFDRSAKASNVLQILRLVRKRRPTLLVMEGTGIAGGLSVLLARRLFGTRYVVSSGDAVGPFVGGISRAAGLPAWIYEWLLYRHSAGFIGWTPYLVGRALTMGAPRGVTAANYAPYPTFRESRSAVRKRLGIPDDVIVFGIAGSLVWNHRYQYCYGLELINAIRQVERQDLAVLIVGGGSGLSHLIDRAGDDLDRRIFLAGRVPRDVVTSYLAAMDVGSLPQSVDQVGAFRYTTKLPEYQSARLPIVMGQVPMAYDVAYDWAWRLPGESPWSGDYVTALAQLMRRIDQVTVGDMRARVPRTSEPFDQSAQRAHVAAFVRDVLEATMVVGEVGS